MFVVKEMKDSFLVRKLGEGISIDVEFTEALSLISVYTEFFIFFRRSLSRTQGLGSE